MNPEPTETEPVKPELSANWSTPAPIPETEPDIERQDNIPPIAEQASKQGWECNYYSFGKLDDQGTDYFNPSLVMRDDGIWMLTRASGLHPRGFMYGQNAIVAFKLDDIGKQPHHGKILHWKDALQLQHFEDPRGFWHPRLGQTMIGCCTFMWNGPGDWTGALQTFGAFDDNWECKMVHYPKIGGNPGKVEKIRPKDYEKNWVWWLHEERLHLLYKSNPWTVHVFENRWSEKTDYVSEGLTWPYGEIRGGTSPVQVGNYFYTFHHSSLPWKGRYRRYYAGCIAFETTPPYRPKYITQEPLLQGSQNDIWAQRKPLVVFPCGALYLKGKWLVSMGVNDLKSAYLELPHEDLVERMKPVDDVSGQIFQCAVPKPVIVATAVLTENDKITGTEHREENACGSQESNGAPSQTKHGGRAYRRKKRKQYSPETLEKLRANAARARAARIEKRNGTLIVPAQRVENVLTLEVPRKRRRRRRKRSTAEARAKALQEYEQKKSLVSEDVQT